MRIWSVQGDISTIGTAAVVVTDNPYGFMVGQAADAIRSAWGEEIELDSVELGDHELGEAWVTEAGPRAPAKFVIHVAAMDRENRTTDNTLTLSTTAALAEADKRRVSSIAFSALGTGAAGHDPHSAGRAIGGAVASYLSSEGSTAIKDIVFVMLDKAVLDDFEKGLRGSFPPP